MQKGIIIINHIFNLIFLTIKSFISASKDKKEDELSDNIFTSASAISLIKPMSSKSAEEDRNHDHSHSHQVIHIDSLIPFTFVFLAKIHI